MAIGLKTVAVVAALQHTAWVGEFNPDFTLAFDDAIAKGTLVCNSFRGRVTSTGGNIKIESLTTTRRGCSPKKMQAEIKLQGDINRIRKFRMKSGQLLLLDIDGREIMRIRAA